MLPMVMLSIHALDQAGWGIDGGAVIFLLVYTVAMDLARAFRK